MPANLVIIRDFNIVGVAVFPPKTDTPLVVDPNAPLTRAIPAQFFEMVGGRDSQIVDSDGVVYHAQFPQSDLLNIGGQLSRALTLIDLLCFVALEGSYHGFYSRTCAPSVLENALYAGFCVGLVFYGASR